MSNERRLFLSMSMSPSFSDPDRPEVVFPLRLRDAFTFSTQFGAICGVVVTRCYLDGNGHTAR